MPPRKNTARRGRPWGKGGEEESPGREAAVGEGKTQSSAAKGTAVATAKPSAPAGDAAARTVKRPPAAARKTVPKTGAAVAAAVSKSVAAKLPTKVGPKPDPKADKASDGEDFEALVLDADDDDAEATVPQEPAEADNDAETAENPVAEEGGDDVESRYENDGNLDAEGDAEVGEAAGEALDGDEAAEEGWEEAADCADGEGDEYDGGEDYGECLDADVVDDDGNEIDAEAGVGLEGDAAESDPVGAERPGEDGLVAANAGEENGVAADEAAEPRADQEGGENGASADAEQPDGGATAGETAGDGEGETIVRDLAPSDRDFVMAEEEEKKEEETLEVTRLSELCPDVALDGPETITVAMRDSIQRSVRRFVERLLQDAKAAGTAPQDSAAPGQEEGKLSYGCRLCNIQLDQPEQFDCHTESQRHSKRLRWMYFMGLNKELGKFHCRVCHISVPCKDHLVGHLRTDRHACLSKALNVHPSYAEHLLGQHFPKAKVQFLLQSQQQQQPSAETASQQGAAGKGKEQKGQKGADKRADTAKGNAGGNQFQESEPPTSQGFIFHCELCQVIAHREDQIQEHYKGKKHRAKMGEELEKLSKQDPAKKASAKGDGAAQASKTPVPAKKGLNSRPQLQQARPRGGPKSSPGATYTCFVCNVVLHSTREYSQHFTTRAHRLTASMQAAPPPVRKRVRSPSPFSRQPLRPWSPPRMPSPPRDIWSSGPPPPKRSPEPFADPTFARDMYGGPPPGPVFESSLQPPSQSGMLEEYTERRGAGPPTDPSSVAATLETMIQLQQRLLSMTGGGGGGAGYHDDEFAAVARGLQDIDLQKSLQQLRQSQRYSVGSSMDSPRGVTTFHDSGPGYQGDSYASNRGYGGGGDMYSGAGDTMESSYASSFGSGGSWVNEYRKSSLGPTAPRPPDFGRPSMGHLRAGGSSLAGKRY